MSFENNESYIIRGEELELLLAGAHMDSWYGIPVTDSPDPKEMTREKINAILAGLYQKEYISWEGDQVLVLEPVRSLVRIISRAPQCLRVDRKDPEAPVMMVYILKDRAAVLEESLWDDRAYRFQLGDKEDFRAYLESNREEWASVETIGIRKEMSDRP